MFNFATRTYEIETSRNKFNGVEKVARRAPWDRKLQQGKIDAYFKAAARFFSRLARKFNPTLPSNFLSKLGIV